MDAISQKRGHPFYNIESCFLIYLALLTFPDPAID